jgi:hypothetical protein
VERQTSSLIHSVHPAAETARIQSHVIKNNNNEENYQTDLEILANFK